MNYRYLWINLPKSVLKLSLTYGDFERGCKRFATPNGKSLLWFLTIPLITPLTTGNETNPIYVNTCRKHRVLMITKSFTFYNTILTEPMGQINTNVFTLNIHTWNSLASRRLKRHFQLHTGCPVRLRLDCKHFPGGCIASSNEYSLPATSHSSHDFVFDLPDGPGSK